MPTVPGHSPEPASAMLLSLESAIRLLSRRSDSQLAHHLRVEALSKLIHEAMRQQCDRFRDRIEQLEMQMVHWLRLHQQDLRLSLISTTDQEEA